MLLFIKVICCVLGVGFGFVFLIFDMKMLLFSLLGWFYMENNIVCVNGCK